SPPWIHGRISTSSRKNTPAASDTNCDCESTDGRQNPADSRPKTPSGQGAAGEQDAEVGGDDRGEEDGEGGENAAQSRCRQKPRRHLHRCHELSDPVRPGDVQRVLPAEVVAGTRLGADLEQCPGERGGPSDLPRSIIGGDLEVEGNR